MKVTAAEFVIGAASPGQFPPFVLPEVAFAGKSNVGKSSLLNTVLSRRKLVKTSAQPGKTQQINFFRINNAFHFVDLPGYGFARAPKAVREQWEGLMAAYLLHRPVLRGVVVILDARHAPSPLDAHMKALLDEAGVPALYVANKVDKLSRGRVAGQLQTIARHLGLEAPPLACSAQTGQGKAELWALLGEWLEAPARERAAP